MDISKINREFERYEYVRDWKNKARVLESGLPEKYSKVKRQEFAEYKLETDGEIVKCSISSETAKKWRSLFFEDENGNLTLDGIIARNLKVSKEKRSNRLKKRIESFLVGGEACFLTLTFTDKVLNHTTAETRREYVRKFLKSFGVPFVANKDFGAKNHREHYHAVIKIPRVDFKKYPYGAIHGQTIHNTADSVKLSKYIAKLTNHAIKETTKRSVLLYSR